MEKYEFEKKINLSQLIEEMKEQNLSHDGINTFFKRIDDKTIYYSKTKLSSLDEKKLNEVFQNHVFVKPKTLNEKKQELKESLTSANTISNIKKVIEKMI